MAKTLIVAEKPSVGGDIARVLGSKGRSKGFISGEEYIITWAIGHLVTLCSPEEIDEKYKEWTFDTLPMLPELLPLKIMPRTRAQFETVKRLMLSDDVSEIICATDSGREGELIFRYIYHIIGCTKPVRRLWISSMTDDAIREGFSRLKPSHEYDNLYESARCRAEADWLVGMNGSRGFTLQYNRLLSVGRVQSPTLAILVAREQERKDFVVENYFELWATFGSYKGRWFDEKITENAHRIPPEKKEWADALAAELKGKPAVVEKVESRSETLKPPQLYDLTQLQRDANRSMGWTATKTLRVAQSLYEKRKLITYPRTDSRYLSADIFKTLKTRLQKLNQPPWEPLVAVALESQRNLFGRVINDAHVSDHHAIIPTGRDPAKASMDEDEKALFDMIARRFIAIFFPDQELEYMEVITRSEGQAFLSRGRSITSPGWGVVYEKAGEKPKARKSGADSDIQEDLPKLQAGDTVKTTSAKVMPKKTTPPPRYTEAMLLSAMENAGRLVEDEELREQMKDNGLGTPATRAAIIERLIQVQYVNRSGRQLVPTQKGCSFVSILPKLLASPEMTGQWEKGLAEIGRGQLDPDRFMDSIRKLVIDLINASRTKVEGVEFPEDYRSLAASGEVPPKEPLGNCPLCDGEIFENRKAYYCSHWRRPGCRFSIWKNALEKEEGPAITPEMIKTLLSTQKLENDTGSFTLGKKAPYLQWTPPEEKNNG